MKNDSDLLVGLSDDVLEALADSVLAPSASGPTGRTVASQRGGSASGWGAG